MNEIVPTINRAAVVVEPREPYLAWARALDGENPTIDTLSREARTSVYLIDEDDDAERSLRRHWEWIFEEQLHSWHRDPRDWPRKRTYKLFRQWFDVRLVGLVFDLGDGPLLQEDL